MSAMLVLAATAAELDDSLSATALPPAPLPVPDCSAFAVRRESFFDERDDDDDWSLAGFDDDDDDDDGEALDLRGMDLSLPRDAAAVAGDLDPRADDDSSGLEDDDAALAADGVANTEFSNGLASPGYKAAADGDSAN